ALASSALGRSSRTLSDLSELDTKEGQIVLGAAILDDIVGLVILSVVSGLVGGVALSVSGMPLTTAIAVGVVALSVSGITPTTGFAVGFVVASVIIGGLVVTPLFRAIARVEETGTLGV